MSNKRHSMMPSAGPSAGPKAPVNFSSSITIADSALVAGMFPITISSESVVHPRARLDSSRGPVNIGRRCIVHERTIIGAGPPAGDRESGAEGSVTLGDYVTVEVGAVVETGGTSIGEGTVVGVGSRVGRGASVGKVRLMADPCYETSHLSSVMKTDGFSSYTALHPLAADGDSTEGKGSGLYCCVLERDAAAG